ncbi:M23 family metallopeptidase [Qipengyuania nanhaisediminis]|uniref:Murein DD-endopeptidase MepM and murein hydrolase activator NlpD, contain LysM domain n=1 Tax=Qipengyuania nanhaisediminis TaxID=604088 RepID=A0A1I5N172_9SPHN|nr:M23 family metallopeptidase [Qipengyuania nanhaisediminis]SFP15655.1 Murein DD-endopeptidase MepM and murein hydrolase activator NlpD, contain LysM domain [Qipengyuania nanhaisediminis]
MNIVDRILTIVVTATITSIVWIVAGGSLIENATSESQRKNTRPAEVAPSPEATPTGDETAEEAAGLDTAMPTSPAQNASNRLLIPVKNIRISDLTDTFSDSRGEGVRLHEAIDIMAPTGTSVVAAAPGTVEKLFRSDAGGNTIYVRSNDGETIHYYAHLDEYAEGLKEGQRVRRGQRLGTVGSSGNASEEAPHLHFAVLQTTADAEWWEPANAVNPYPLLTGQQ